MLMLQGCVDATFDAFLIYGFLLKRLLKSFQQINSVSHLRNKPLKIRLNDTVRF